LSGESKNSAHLHKIARGLETSPSYLTGETDDPRTGAIPKPTASLISEQLDAVQIAELNLSLGMGGSAIFDDEISQKQRVFSRAWIQQFTNTHPSKLYFATGFGDSMNPTINDADIVLIDTGQRSPNQTDRIWAITHYGGGQIKRLRHFGKGYKIISDNPDLSDEISMDGELSVIGRVVAIMRKV
jgi:phage repressor protein C with HTH and peptisase S24 domain